MLKLSKTSTIARTVSVQLGTDDPGVFNEGTITVRYNILPKSEIIELTNQGTSDHDYIRRVVADVSGLCGDNDQPLSGEAALAEVLDGRLSMYLQRAILDEFFDHFGDVRVKNSRPSRGR